MSGGLHTQSHIQYTERGIMFIVDWYVLLMRFFLLRSSIAFLVAPNAALQRAHVVRASQSMD